MIVIVKTLCAKVWRVLVYLLVLTAKRPTHRENQPIWAVPPAFRNIYFAIVSILGGPPLFEIVSREIQEAANPGWYDDFVQITTNSALAYGPIGLGIAIAVFVGMHAGGPLTVLYQTLANKFLVPVIEAHEARGEKRGEARGEARGYAKGINAMKDWLSRKEAAISEGKPFAEPPPGDEA